MKNLQQLLLLSLVVVGLLLSTSPSVACGSSLVLARTERASTSRARHRPERPTRRCKKWPVDGKHGLHGQVKPRHKATDRHTPAFK
ncbi:hypothetical protein BaRGS_00040564 [Batillaria attramentaria]|uniref:Secreted protein n=1 Tax=Batillaria attramentaria TaxID=370345 RepID=A0ABD0IZP8_9CAEN